MYSIVWFISKFAREFIIPNPFDCLNGKNIEIVGVDIPIIPEIIMILIDSVIVWLTYKVVGFYYSKSERKPAKGSLLFLLFYTIHILAIYVIANFNFSKLSIILTIIGYILFHILFVIIKNVINNTTSKIRSF